MSILTAETKLPGFWYELIRLSDSREKRIALAEKIAGLFALVDADVHDSEISEEALETAGQATACCQVTPALTLAGSEH